MSDNCSKRLYLKYYSNRVMSPLVFGWFFGFGVGFFLCVAFLLCKVSWSCPGTVCQSVHNLHKEKYCERVHILCLNKKAIVKTSCSCVQ